MSGNMWDFSTVCKNKLEDLLNSKFKTKSTSFQQEEWKFVLDQLGLNTCTKKVQHDIQYFNIEHIDKNMIIEYSYNTNSVARDVKDLCTAKLRSEYEQEDQIVKIKTQDNEDIRMMEVRGMSGKIQPSNLNSAGREDARTYITKEELCEFISQATNTNVDICKYKVSEIKVLWDLFISLEPDNASVESFFEFLLKPLLLSEESSRSLDLCLRSAYEDFPDQLINVIILPTILSNKPNYNASLFVWINIANDKDKLRVLNSFFNNDNLWPNQIPLLEKIITMTNMDDPVISKLITFIHQMKDKSVSSIPAFGKFLGNVIKILRSRITSNERDFLEEIVRSNTSSFKKFALSALGLK